jgi:hypothetical protein
MPADLDSAIVVLTILALLGLYALVALPVVRSLELRLALRLLDRFLPEGDGGAGAGGPSAGRELAPPSSPDRASV